jgi:hypothetical protein
MILHTTYNIPKRKGSTGITGCIVCPNVIMIFVENYNSRLAIPNEDGIINKEIHCSLRHPFDITCLDDTTVTLSTYNGIEVTLIPSDATR